MSYIAVFVAIISIAFFKILQNYFKNTFNYWKKRGVNGPRPLPIVGNFIASLTKPAKEIDDERARKYGRVYGTFEFSTPNLSIADPILIREVAIKQFHNFQNRYNKVPNDEFLKKTMFFSTDEKWKRLRSYLTPLFTTKKMKDMFPFVDECAKNTLQYIEGIGDNEVIAKQLMLSFTMDVIVKCAFGVNTNGYKNPNDEFLVRAREMSQVKFWRLMASFLIPKSIQKLHKSLECSFFDRNVYKYFKDILMSIINQRKSSDVEYNDFVNLMLSLEEIDSNEDSKMVYSELSNDCLRNTKTESKGLTAEEILAQAFLLFFAGYETTSTLLNYVVYALAMNTEIQEKLYDEIVKYFHDKDNIDFDTIHSMPYLDAVVNESLRMYPPVVSFDRVAAEDIVLGEQKINIEKGTVVNLSFYAIQHDAEFFPEPHAFKPERFLPENKHLIEPYTFIPFGVGPRICIGTRFALMTAKVLLIKLVQRFKILRTNHTPLTPNYTIVIGALASEPILVAFAAR